MPPGLADEVTQEEEPPCCSTKGGLCEWVEPPCEFLSEDDRKKTVWDDVTCNAIHPDDMKEIAWRYGLYKAQQKRILYARVYMQVSLMATTKFQSRPSQFVGTLTQWNSLTNLAATDHKFSITLIR